MIPRLHKRGKSFKETLNYVLHDADAQTHERVAWSLTQNIYSPVDVAWFEMFETYNSQEALKAAAGVDRRGRKNTSPVLHYSLSWSPDEKPMPELMQATALASLKALGLSEHEAVLVGHDEKAHAHVHIVVNTVHPLTGRTASLKFSKLDLSRWAEAYEKEHGVVCETRVQNNEDRRILAEQRRDETGRILTAAAEGQPINRAPYVPIKDQSPNRRAWMEIKEREALGAKILAKLTAHDSTFTRQDLAKEISKRTSNAEGFNHLLAHIEASAELVALPGKDRYSTRTMVALEGDLAQIAGRRARSLTFSVDRSSAPSTDGIVLSDEQSQALAHVTGPAALTALVGYAGTGKSTMLGQARALWEGSGYSVRGAALSGVAAQNLQDGSGIASSTIHRLLWRLENGHDQLSAKDVVVVDEAGMVGSRQMHALLSAVDKAGAKLVLVGDPEQLRAIDAGAAFRAIAERTGTAMMTDIRRQRTRWQREATLDLAQGRVARALSAYEDAGRVLGFDEKATAVDDMVERWASDTAKLQPGQSSIMLAATNATVDALNERVRSALKAGGSLGEEKMLRAIDEGIGRPRTEFEMPVAVGDKLMFTRNDYKLDVRNGTLGTLESFGPGAALNIRIDGKDPRLIAVDLSRYRNFIYGYAMTIHKAQGVTVDRAHVMAERSMDANLSYVSLSRHKESVTLYWARDELGSRVKLDRIMGRDRPKDTTLDYLDPRGALPRTPMREPGGLDKSLSRTFTRQDGHRTPRSSALREEMQNWKKERPGRVGFGREL